MENGQSVFFLSPHTLPACKTLTPRFTDFLTDFEGKKTTVLQSTNLEIAKHAADFAFIAGLDLLEIKSFHDDDYRKAQF